jgi:signal transduction histidine kinase/ActR/RegA family two-component response regulator
MSDAAADHTWRNALQTWLSLPDCALAVIDAQACVHWLSPGAAALAGVAADAARGQSLPSLLGWREPQPLLAALAGDGRLDDARFASPGRAAGELCVHRVHLRPLPAPASAPPRFVASLADVSREHRLAGELARSVEATPTQLRIALDAARVGLWRHELNTDRIHFDARAMAILGRSERTAGMPLDEVRSWVHPEDLPLVLASAQQTLASGEPSEVQVRYRHADGHWLYLLTRRALERDAQGRPVAFIGVGLDMTEQVERTAQALDLAERLESAARAAGLGLWSGSLDGEGTVWNAQMYALFDLVGQDRPPTLRNFIAHCVHPADRDRVRARAKAFLDSGGEPFELELRALQRDGSVRWVVMRADHDRAHGDGMRRVGGIALDVTAAREAQAALRRANERVELITRSLGIGTWEVDLDTGHATWDAAMFTLRGLPTSAQPPDDAQRLALVHPDDRAQLQEVYTRANAQGLSTQLEFRVRLPDGRWRWLASRSVLLPASDGRGARRIGINWDVSEARLAEAALRDKLLAQRESAAKSHFLARMSHELRTPLNAVIGFTQLLLHDNGHADAATRKTRLRHIDAAGRHLLALIDEVLDLTRVSSGELRLELGALPLERVVGETLPLVEAEARALDVSVELGALAARVRADPTRLRQVLLNLLSNAIKYNRRGGWVHVSAQTLAPAGDAPRVRLSVADSGRGLDEEQQRQLFEPFNRLGAERQGIAGTGIGLTIVKALVEQMGGTVALSSTPGVGSRFDVELPAAADDEPDTAPTPLPEGPSLAPEPLPRRRRLLYIEDNAVNRTIVEQLIERRGGIALECAVDGDSGVRAAQADPPALVLVDMQLPDCDGHEVLRRLRADARTAALPCIAVSANALPQDIERALAAGFADYWTKPLDLRAFMKALDRLLGPATEPAP